MHFSVVIPLYNKRPYITTTLRSVFEQGEFVAEVVVVDDGSTDGGADLVSESFPSAHLIRQQNAGSGPARNAGIRAASNEWVALIDADDRWLPGHLDEIAQLIQRFPEARLVGSRHTEVRDGDGGLRLSVDTTDPDRRVIDYFLEASRSIAVISSSSVAVHRATALDIGGFGHAPLGQDLEFWARMALRHPVAHSSAATALYLRGIGGNVETTEARYRKNPRPTPSSLEQLSPSAATVVSALRSGDFSVPEEHLRVYLDGRVSSAMLQRLARGDVEGARALARSLHRPYRPPARLASALAKVPAPAFRAALRTRNSLRNMGQRRS